jgi:S1-C subfamily serine protease
MMAPPLFRSMTAMHAWRRFFIVACMGVLCSAHGAQAADGVSGSAAAPHATPEQGAPHKTAEAAIPVTESGFGPAVAKVVPRVIKLYGLGVGEQVGYGSGVLVSARGQVVTVSTLLIDARTIRATAADGTRYHAVVLHRDHDRQLALLQLLDPDDPHVANSNATATPSASPGTQASDDPSAESRPWPQDFPHFDADARTPITSGDLIIAASNAHKVADGAEPVSLAVGTVATRVYLDARRRARPFDYHREVFVTDAITNNPGAAGGAVVDLEGRFVGVIGRQVICTRTNTHLNYIVPASEVAAFLRDARGSDCFGRVNG